MKDSDKDLLDNINHIIPYRGKGPGMMTNVDPTADNFGDRLREAVEQVLFWERQDSIDEIVPGQPSDIGDIKA